MTEPGLDLGAMVQQDAVRAKNYVAFWTRRSHFYMISILLSVTSAAVATSTTFASEPWKNGLLVTIAILNGAGAAATSYYGSVKEHLATGRKCLIDVENFGAMCVASTLAVPELIEGYKKLRNGYSDVLGALESLT